MSEENKQVDKGIELKNDLGEQAKENQAVLKNNEDPVAARAAEQGWRPLEEWVEDGGDPAEWRDARSFLDRGELLNRISSQSKEMKELRKTLKAFEDLNKRLAETKFKEKLDELKVEKKEALEAGDAARVVELDEQMDMVKDSLAESKASTLVKEEAAPEIHPDFQRWVDKNSWYGQNNEMREFADSIGIAYAKSNRGKSPAEVLTYVEGRVKKAYSEMFENQRREAPNAVETGGGTRKIGNKRSGPSEADLPPEAVEVMQTLVKGGHMTKDEYIKQYFLK
jgi:hypothetical protein